MQDTFYTFSRCSYNNNCNRKLQEGNRTPKQVHNGVYIRMAIILALLGIPDPLTGTKVLNV